MKKTIRGFDRFARIALLLTLGCSAQAFAQTEETPGEIVVTAQKRAERLQDVPISITAFGGEALQKSRVTTLDDMVSKVPNLQLIGTQGENTPIFSLRGVSMSDYSINQSGPVATYYDEVYKGNLAFLGVAMYDLERVEVLRGPQGTLYGKNTTGGAVNLISRKPTLGETNGYLNLGYGNYNRHEANGALNLPLGDTAALRVAGTFARADGWFKNKLPGQPDLNSTREYGLRGSLLWEPSDGVSFLLRASTSYQNPYNYGIFANVTADGIGAGVYEAFESGSSYFRDGLGRREVEANYTPRRRARANAISLTSSVDVGGGLSVTSVTSWDKGSSYFGEDTDGSPLRAVEIYYADRASQFAQDLRLTSDWDGPFDFILGAYFNREKVYNQTVMRLFGDVDVTGDGTVDIDDCEAALTEGLPMACLFDNSFDQVKKSYALYSDMHMDLGDRVTLRGGLRFTHDKGRQYNFLSTAYGVDGIEFAPLIPPTAVGFSRNNLSGKIGLDFKVDRDILLYANYARGYRASSFNAQAFFDPDEISIAKPEEIDAFEVGAKTQLFDRRVTFNAGFFYYLYQNQQFINVEPNVGAQRLVNVDRSRLYGGEGELTVHVSDGFTLRGGFGLLSSRIKRGVLNGESLVGNRLANAPSLTLNAGFDATLVEAGDSKLSFHPDISYVSSQYFDVFNKPELKQSGYAQLGAHLDFEHGPLSASLWAKNITNKYYFTSRIDLIGGFGMIYNHIAPPRTFGATIGYKF